MTPREHMKTTGCKLFVPFAFLLLAGPACEDEGGTFVAGGVEGILTGVYTQNLHLTRDKRWLLRGPVQIGDGTSRVLLRIDPGTTIYGESSTIGALIVNRNAQIIAEGTRDQPIVFTSAKPEGQRQRGDWGGVVINGSASLNECVEDLEPCQSFGEGGTGFYGGTNDQDNSGTLRYVRIEFAGKLFSPENELNGLALQAVGSGTTLDYIQVHMNADDGIEFFGGTADIKHAYITGCADDSLDWTDGWRGRGQFIAVQQYEDAGDRGIEADNNGRAGRDPAIEPRSEPTLSHLTLIGNPRSDSSDVGILLRAGTRAKIANTLVAGFQSACLDIDGEETFAGGLEGNAPNGRLSLQHSIISCAEPFDEEAEDPFAVSDWFNARNPGNTIEDPGLADPYDLRTPDLRPKADSPARSGARAPEDAFFERVDYRGAIDPDDDWTQGWTTAAAN